MADYISRKGYRIENIGVMPTDLIPSYVDDLDYIFSLRDQFQEKLNKLKTILSHENAEIVVKNGDIIIKLSQNVFEPKQENPTSSFNMEKIKQSLAIFSGHRVDIKCFAGKAEAPNYGEREKLSKKRAEVLEKYLLENKVTTKDKLSAYGLYSFEIDAQENDSRHVEITIKQAMK